MPGDDHALLSGRCDHTRIGSNMNTTRSRLLASSFLCGAALAAAAPAMAQSADPQSGNVQTRTTEANGQSEPSTTTTTNAGGFNAVGDAGTTVGEVVVTGSRISRRDYVSSSPIVSISPKAIENTGASTLDRLINQIPQFVPGLGSQNNNPGNGQVNANLRGLGAVRTLVLVDGRRVTPSNVTGVVDLNTVPNALIENIEVITGGASTAYGSDAISGVLNFKLKHNFTGVAIDAQYNGTELGKGEEQAVTVTIGGNFADDRGNAVLSLGYSNRGSIFYGDRDDVVVPDFATIGGGQVDARVLAVSGLSGTIPQGKAQFIAGNLPTQAAVNSVFGSYGVANGAVLPNYQVGFNNGGSLFNGAANYRGPTSIDFSTITSSPTLAGGGLYNTGALNYILLPLTRYNAFTSGEYALTPHLKAYGQFNFTNYRSDTQLAPSPASGNPSVGGTGFLVPANNPFIPADLRTLLNSRVQTAASPTTTGPGAPFLLSKRFTDVGARNSSNEYTVYQALVGLKGDVPGMDISYDVYASYGRLNRLETQTGNISHANLRNVLEAPVTAGGGACSTYNIFGQNGITAACQAYISPQTRNQTTFTQRVVEATAQGHLINMPEFMGFGGGEVRFAVGTDYRSDKAQFLPDALLSSSDVSNNSYTLNGTTYALPNNTGGVVGFNGGQPVSGTIDVYELYAELLVPIAKDLPFAKSINLDLGGRYSDYSTVGSIYTYKADLEWRVFDWLLLRGGYSRAIRAPNNDELFSPASNGFFNIGNAAATSQQGDPCDIRGSYRRGANGAAVRALCLAQGVPASLIDLFQFDQAQVQALAGGNPNLRQERANTYSGGIVLQPKFSMPLFSRVSASIDYYNINVKGAIGSVGPATQLTKCFNADGSNPSFSNAFALCNLFVRDPASGQIVSGSANLQNLGANRVSGVDFQVDWSFGLDALPYLGLSDRLGSLAFNLVATWQNDFDVQTLPGDVFQQNRGYAFSGPGGFVPVWKGALNVNYHIGPFDIGVAERYIGDATDGSCVGVAAPCADLTRGALPTFYTDLNGRWRINEMLELRGGVINATNQEPRFFASGSSSQGGTDASTYDLIGRRYFVALKARF